MQSDSYPQPSLGHFLRDEAGVSIAKYILVAALISVVSVIALLALSKGV